MPKPARLQAIQMGNIKCLISGEKKEWGRGSKFISYQTQGFSTMTKSPLEVASCPYEQPQVKTVVGNPNTLISRATKEGKVASLVISQSNHSSHSTNIRDGL